MKGVRISHRWVPPASQVSESGRNVTPVTLRTVSFGLVFYLAELLSERELYCEKEGLLTTCVLIYCRGFMVGNNSCFLSNNWFCDHRIDHCLCSFIFIFWQIVLCFRLFKVYDSQFCTFILMGWILTQIPWFISVSLWFYLILINLCVFSFIHNLITYARLSLLLYRDIFWLITLILRNGY